MWRSNILTGLLSPAIGDLKSEHVTRGVGGWGGGGGRTTLVAMDVPHRS